MPNPQNTQDSGINQPPFGAAPFNQAHHMKNERSEPNAELAGSFEPLRIGFAVLALLLGLIASLRF